MPKHGSGSSGGTSSAGRSTCQLPSRVPAKPQISLRDGKLVSSWRQGGAALCCSGGKRRVLTIEAKVIFVGVTLLIEVIHLCKQETKRWSLLRYNMNGWAVCHFERPEQNYCS